MSCQEDFKISFWKSNEPRTKGLFISQRFSIPFLINENEVDLNCISCHRTCDSIVAEKRFSQTSHATINDSTEQGYFNDEFILCKRGSRRCICIENTDWCNKLGFPSDWKGWFQPPLRYTIVFSRGLLWSVFTFTILYRFYIPSFLRIDFQCRLSNRDRVLFERIREF